MDDTTLRAALRPGEALAWTAKPEAEALARSRAGLALLGLPFLVLGLGCMAAGGGAATALWSLPVLLLGLVMTAAPLLARAQAPRMAYAVTTQRVLVLDATPLIGGVRELELDCVTGLERHGADLVLLRDPACESEAGALWRFGFAGLAQPDAAEARLRTLLALPPAVSLQPAAA